MVVAAKHPIKSWGWILLLLLTVLSAWSYLPYYIRPGLNVMLCLILAPFVIRVRQQGVYSFRYGGWAVLCLLGFLSLHVQVLLFFATGCTMMFIVESWKGKMGWLPAVLMLLLSAIPSYISDIFTVSLRIRMSQLTAEWLQFLGHTVEVSGNIFLLDGMSFSVDQACMGLHSIVTGLILITLAAAYGEQRYRRSFRFWPLTGIFVIGLILMILGNQIRMLMLVMFRSPPETLGHELIGLACLLIYGGVPVWLLVHCLLKTGGASVPFEAQDRVLLSPAFIAKWVFPMILIATLGWINLHFDQYKYPEKDPELAQASFPGFEETRLQSGIVKLENESALVYIKPPVSSFRSEHTPSICWRSSGYVMHHIREEIIAGQKLLRAEFRKGPDVLHTAWWFDNGTHKTHEQWEWRWETLKGAPRYRLINVTVADPNQLEFWCKAFLDKDWHRH